MSNKTRDLKPRGLRPVQRIELSDSNFKPKFMLMIAFLIIGIAALGVFLWSLLDTEPGWKTVEVASSERNCSGDFVFTYYLGKGDLSPSEEERKLSALYTEMSVKAYKLFNRYESFSGVHNVCYINAHLNEVVTVDEALYNAFSKMKQYDSRYLYLAPLHSQYSSTFFGPNATTAVEDKDPYSNEEYSLFFGELAAYAANPEAIDLELLGNNQVRLAVSEEYLKYAEENGIEVFVDFFRVKNAFVIDYFADVLQENGYTNGSISSYDGYVRNLDNSGEGYYINLFDSNNDYVYNAAKLNYTNALSIVSLRSFPMGEMDGYDFYVSSVSGKSIPPYVDINDGLYKTATDSLVSYSKTLGCSDILMMILDKYVAEELDVDAINALTDSDLYTILFEDATVIYNAPDAVITDLYSIDNVTYKAEYRK